MAQEQSAKVRIFVSYSHQDKRYLKDSSLLGYLRGLNKAEFWFDERITTGDYWDENIKENIERSEIALVLVSQAFLNSSYVNKVEIPAFMKKRKDEGMVIFPIVLSACNWEQQPWLAATQFLPREGKNIESDFRDSGKRKALFLQVLRDLEQHLDRILRSRASIPNSRARLEDLPIADQPSEGSPESRKTVEKIDEREAETNRSELQNPFDSAAANNLDFEDIPQLFVGEYTPLDSIKRPFDALIEGQRGTGKTMVLKYLAFETQAKVWSNANKSVTTELQKRENFIGIYSRLDQGVFDRSDLDFVDQEAFRLRLFEHRLVLFLLSHILRTASAINRYVQIASGAFGQFRDRFAILLREPRIRDCSNWDEFNDFAQNTIDMQVTQEDLFLGSMSAGVTPLEPFNAWLTLSSQLIPVLELAQKVFAIKAPFFFLLDDFDVLRPSQQGLVFAAASARRLDVVAFKYGVMSMGKKTDMSGSGRTYREGDDYLKVSLDFWSSGGLQNDYRKAVEKLTAKRLEQRGWPEKQFGSMLGEWARGRELRGETKEIMKKEWKQLPPGRRPKTFENYWTKYGNARFFQLLAERKIHHTYAGYDTVVDVSSGIYRQYVELCSQIVSAALTRGWRPNSKKLISPTVQDGAIRSYSGAMKDSLSVTAGNVPMTVPGTTEVTSKAMTTFVESLSGLFKSRLASFGREPEIFSIAIRGDLNAKPTAKAILDVAVRESILHRRADYTPKTGGGPPLPTYMLNRRLAPRIGLGLRIQGRIEITPEDVVAATDNPELFLKRFQARDDSVRTENLFNE
jgi:hypothetical protein